MVTDGKETCAGAHLAVYTNIKSLLCTPEANVLYVNYTSVGKKKKRPTYGRGAPNEAWGCKPPPLKRQPPSAEFKEGGS